MRGGDLIMVSDELTGGGIALRPAVYDDAEPIARLHDQVWREIYQGLATPEAWAALTWEVRGERWRETLSAPARWRTLVAERHGAIIGFGASGPPSEAVFGDRGEIRWLHVDRRARGGGVGRRLTAALARDLAGAGHRGCALAVVVGNGPAIAFYRRLGGCEIGAFTDPGPLWRSENLVFAWDDLSELIAAAG